MKTVENLVPDETQIDPASYQHIIVAADASRHSDRAINEAITLAEIWQAEITGAHVYAAKLHDRRFRQMEGGLPEEFKEENELERQRDIHDQLITKGLSIITDSYLDQAENDCKQAGIDYQRCSLEGKNYRELVKETQTGKHDLMVLGALGLGATEGSSIGTVCERVVRRSGIDTLVIKQPDRPIKEGPVVVAIDGSKKSFASLITALTIARHWQLQVHVISAYDPYYHYVAFNSIAKVLSDEAGKVFRFKEQEKLHEDIIDAGLAKIYQGHLHVAQSMADEFGYDIKTKLLDGKPYDVIEKYVRSCDASLLVIGKLGIHADDELDIGGNAENLLRNIPCALLIGQKEYTPKIEIMAEATTSWTNQAEERMKFIPSFARGMARTAILRFAQEQGHTVITEKIVKEATKLLCPAGMASDENDDDTVTNNTRSPLQQIEEINPVWSDLAQARLDKLEPLSVRENIQHRAEKKARQQKSAEVTLEHLKDFLNQTNENKSPDNIHWQSAALARLNRVPAGFMRNNVKTQVLENAASANLESIDLALIEKTIESASKTMKNQMSSGGKCPFKAGDKNNTTDEIAEKSAVHWQQAALKRLEKVPAGTIRAMARKATETIAIESNISNIDKEFFSNILATFQKGSDEVTETMPWTSEARLGINKAPVVVQGMLIREIEKLARQNNASSVDIDTVNQAKQSWDDTGFFHLDKNDSRSATQHDTKSDDTSKTGTRKY